MTLRTDDPRSGNRFYSWGNENFWSVTTIIGGGYPKAWGIGWGIKATAEGVVNSLESGIDLAKMAEHDRDAAVRWIKALPYAGRDRAAELGTSVHLATEAYILGKPFPEWTPLVKPRMLAFERFLADYAPEFEATEASVFSRAEHYAGTLDAICRLDGWGRWLVDYKTGKGVYPEVGLQLAAYRFAEFIGLPDGSEAPMPDVDGCACLHLPEEAGGYEFLQIRADAQVFRDFLYVRETFRHATEVSKTIVGGPVPLPKREAA
jgi:hypothetical protein